MTTRLRRHDLDRLLRHLDPADPDPTPPIELRRLADQLRTRVDVLGTAGSSRRPGRSRHRVVGAVSGALVLAAAGALVVALTQWTPQQAGPAAPDAAAQEIVRRSNPLAVGRSVDCMGQVVPAWTLALPGGVENADTPESAALREFIAANPFAGMGSVSGGNWIRIGTSDDPLVFGQRRGQLGMGTVVTLARSGTGWTATGTGGCGLILPGPGEQAAFVQGATVDGRTLRVWWENGLSGKTLEKGLVRVETIRDDAGLHVMVVTKDNPAFHRPSVDFGVGTGSAATITLPAGVVAPKVIFDDSVLPSQEVPVT